MTRGEKAMMENPGRCIFANLPPDVQHAMRRNKHNLQALTPDGGWFGTAGGINGNLRDGMVYRVIPGAEADPEYTVVPVTIIGRNPATYVFNPNLEGVIGLGGNLLLTYAICAVGFAGIRYRGSTEWRGVLDTVAYGEPEEVRFVRT